MPLRRGISLWTVSLLALLCAAPLGAQTATQSSTQPQTQSQPAAQTAPLPFDPPAIYLTWVRDPSTTIVVQWHSIVPPAGSDPHVHDIVWFGRAGEELSRSASGHHHALPASDRLVHWTELTGLQPKTDYQFRIGENSVVFKFRTMPADAGEPITFVSGGDMGVGDSVIPLCDQAAKLDPAFAVIGGDIAYTDDDPAKIGRWYKWFDIWKKHMVAPDGRLIPLLVTIGNHEVAGGYATSNAAALQFYSLIAMPGQRGYAALDFGNYLSIILLDSSHTNPIEGDQTDWLKDILSAREKTHTHLLAFYHTPAYPSHRLLSTRYSKAIRANWVPLFERYGVDVAYEHHDHTFKRSHLIKNDKIDPAGVLYLGDGAWGKEVRPVHPPGKAWYLATAGSVGHFWATTIHGEARLHRAIDYQGNCFDVYPPGAAATQPASMPATQPGEEEE